MSLGTEINLSMLLGTEAQAKNLLANVPVGTEHVTVYCRLLSTYSPTFLSSFVDELHSLGVSSLTLRGAPEKFINDLKQSDFIINAY